MKLDLAVIVLSIAGAMLWIEHGHRIDLATSTSTAAAAQVAAVCPERENVPYGTECILFMQGNGAPERLRWTQARANTPPDAPSLADDSRPACAPNNENIPYSANCIKFMSGWFWQANPPPRSAP